MRLSRATTTDSRRLVALRAEAAVTTRLVAAVLLAGVATAALAVWRSLG